jgi:aryl-alcohol dehydrogenase-like predicted oxidoreductase
MDYRQFDDSSLQVSVPGLGCNQLGVRLEAGQTRAVHSALDAGITRFDIATCSKPTSE